MKDKKILISLEFSGLPPSINHSHINAHGRRFRTKECRDFQAHIINELKLLWRNKPAFIGRAYLDLTLITNNKRRWDIDNRLKALQDCLTMAGVIKDDSQIDRIKIERLYQSENKTLLRLFEIKKD